MREAVIVSTARTAIGKAYRGAFNNTQAQTLGGHAIAHAVGRANVAGEGVDNVVMGAAMQQGATGYNIARQFALRAGLPSTVSAQSMDRQCLSGLVAIATTAERIIVDGMGVVVGGGESISLVQNEYMNTFRAQDPELLIATPGMYVTMIETAEVVAERYKASRESQVQYALQSQERTAQAPAEGRFDLEIMPMSTTMQVVDKGTGAQSFREVTLSADEGNSPQTTLGDLQRLQPVWKGSDFAKEGRNITAANASQLADGASAVVLMDAKLAERRGLTPLGAYRGMAVAGCSPEEMRIGPVLPYPSC
jgi:acetyl-CoA C-acetyltransferase